jgi:hypothetical protein
MSNLQNKFMNRLFRRISGVVIDATTGKTGIKTDDGVYSIDFDKDGKDHTVSVNLIDALSFSVPGYATQVAFEKVAAGDLVVSDKGILGWVVGKTGKALKVADHHGMTKTYTPPKVAILGGAGPDGVLVVQTLFSLTGSADGAAGLGASLLPLMMLGGGDNGKLDKILPFLLMQGAAGGGAAAGGLNSILPLLLLGKEGGLGGGDLDPMMLLAMSGGLGGAGAEGGMNPMLLMALAGKGGDLFGSDTPKLAPSLNRTGGVPQLQPTRW